MRTWVHKTVYNITVAFQASFSSEFPNEHLLVLQYSTQRQCCADCVALAKAALLVTYQLHDAIALS